MYERDPIIVLTASLQERLIRTIKERLPQKSFGYLLSTGDVRSADDFILFEDNVRNSDEWQGRFQSYGQYFIDHDDAGFVATPEETWLLQKEIWARGMIEVGIFHSHLRHPANFSQIDYDMHMQRFPNLWHLIISMRNPELPQLRVFAVSEAGTRELHVVPAATDGEPCADRPSVGEEARNEAIMQAQRLLKLDNAGWPLCRDSRAIFSAINALLLTECYEAIEELVVNGFLRGSMNRYEEHIAPDMRLLGGGRYEMGTNQVPARHFYGEVPCHTVELSPFNMAQVQVTNELFALFDQRRLDGPARDLRKPAVNLTWFDATVFAMWMGCRLPTEAEWEFACGLGSAGEWCCGDEELLPQYAWFSENFSGEAHEVGSRKANSLGLFDLHGNVWEWCQDSYDQDYYSRSPVVDPVNIASPLTDKVCRGGSMYSLSEMCRTRYRFHEFPAFWAADLGFRLAKSCVTASIKGEKNG